MGELVLHIGAQKTGTTALQKFFVSNRSQLSDYGWSYPPLTAQLANSNGSRNGNFLVRFCRDRLENVCKARDIKENMRLLEQALTSYPHVLLSDEEFFYTPARLSDVCTEKAIREFWSEVSEVISELPVSRTTVILYLRRQDEWLASWWKEAVKHGGTEKSFADYSLMPGVRTILNYASLIDSIERALGESCTVVVRLYNRNGFEGGSIFSDFCYAAGIPWSSDFSLPKKDLNSSISFDVAEALRGFRSTAPFGEDLRMQRLIPLACTLSQENPDPSGMTPFSKEESEALMNSYREENERIAKRFFGRSELFPADNREPIVWKPDVATVQRYTHLFQKECQRDRAQRRLLTPFHSIKKTVSQKMRALRRD